MGLADTPTQANLQDVYPPPTAFIIEQAWSDGPHQTRFGKKMAGHVVIRPLAGGEGQEFTVWGTLQEQVGMVEDDDLGKAFRLEQEGNKWLFRAAPDAEIPGVNAQTDAEAALGIEPQSSAAGEATQPPPASAQADPGAHEAPGVAADSPPAADAPSEAGAH